jgi:hypothetical protein
MSDEQTQHATQLLREAVMSPQRLPILEASIERAIRTVSDPTSRAKLEDILNDVREESSSPFGSGGPRRDLDGLSAEGTSAPATPRRSRR